MKKLKITDFGMKISSIFVQIVQSITRVQWFDKSSSVNGTKLGRHNSTQSIHKQQKILCINLSQAQK